MSLQHFMGGTADKQSRSKEEKGGKRHHTYCHPKAPFCPLVAFAFFLTEKPTFDIKNIP